MRTLSARTTPATSRGNACAGGKAAASPLGSGSATEKQLPLPGSVSTAMRPSIAVTSRLEIASPRPVPVCCPLRRDAAAW